MSENKKSTEEITGVNQHDLLDKVSVEMNKMIDAKREDGGYYFTDIIGLIEANFSPAEMAYLAAMFIDNAGREVTEDAEKMEETVMGIKEMLQNKLGDAIEVKVGKVSEDGEIELLETNPKVINLKGEGGHA